MSNIKPINSYFKSLSRVEIESRNLKIMQQHIVRRESVSRVSAIISKEISTIDLVEDGNVKPSEVPVINAVKVILTYLLITEISAKTVTTQPVFRPKRAKNKRVCLNHT